MKGGPLAAAKDKTTPAAALAFLWEAITDRLSFVRNDPDTYIDIAISLACNPNTPTRVLQTLNHVAGFGHTGRIALAQHPNTDADTLHELAEPLAPKDSELAKHIARHPNTTGATLEEFFAPSTPGWQHEAYVLIAAAANPNAPSTLLLKYLTYEGESSLYLHRAVAANPNLPTATIQRLSKQPELVIELATNPRTPAATLRKFVASRPGYNYGSAHHFISALLKNPNTPIDVLEQLARSETARRFPEIAAAVTQRLAAEQQLSTPDRRKKRPQARKPKPAQ